MRLGPRKLVGRQACVPTRSCGIVPAVNLTLEHARVLAIFSNGQPSSTAEVAAALHVDHAIAAKLCTELRELGLLDEETEQ